MDLSKLSNGQRIGGAAGIVLLINMFLPWYSAFSISRNAWQDPAAPLAWLASILGIAAAVLLVLPAFGVQTPKVGNLVSSQLSFIGGALAAILIVLKWLTDSDFVSFGLFLGLLAAIGVAVGAFLAMKEAGVGMPWEGMGGSGGGGDAGGGGGTTPPSGPPTTPPSDPNPPPPGPPTG